MTTFQHFNGSLQFWGEVELGNYRLVQSGPTRLVLEAADHHDPIWQPYRVVFTIKNGETYFNAETGQLFYTAGTVTGVTWLNDEGDKLAQVTGLKVDAAIAWGHANWSNETQKSSYFWDYVLTNNPAGATFIGSDETGIRDLDYAAALPDFDKGDDIATTTGNDTVRAGGNSDWISDYGGSDIYDGQAGSMDIVSYFGWRHLNLQGQTGINADLQAGRVIGPDGQVDRLISIEAISGTNHADVLRGSSVDNIFLGRAGNDTIDGRSGFDTAWYDYDNAGGIVVDMARGIVRDGFGGRDRLTSIEEVVGTRLRDKFIDATGAQSFDGRDGDDHFTLGKGADTITGGMGADVFKFVGRSFGTDTITDFDSVGGDRIHITALRRFSGVQSEVVGDDLVITVATSRIVLEGMAEYTLISTDFIFG